MYNNDIDNNIKSFLWVWQTVAVESCLSVEVSLYVDLEPSTGNDKQKLKTSCFHYPSRCVAHFIVYKMEISAGWIIF